MGDLRDIARPAEVPGDVAKIDPESAVSIDSETLADYDRYPSVLAGNGKLLRKLNFLLPESKFADLVGAAVCCRVAECGKVSGRPAD